MKPIHSKQQLPEKVDVKTITELLPELLQNTDNATSHPRKRSRFLKYMDDTKLEPPQPSYPLEDYLSATCLSKVADPLAYWKGQEDLNPTLAKLACQYLQIPASSAPVEHLFSVAGKIFTSDRCNLIDANFEKLMFIRCNGNN